MIIGGCGSGKTNALINLINEQIDIDKIYLYARDLSEQKYEYLIKKLEDAEIKHVNNPNAFIECSNIMDDVYENINDYNRSRKRKILIVFDNLIADIMTKIKDFKPKSCLLDAENLIFHLFFSHSLIFLSQKMSD